MGGLVETAHGHHGTVVGAGRDDELGGDGLVRGQRVVAASGKALGYAIQDRVIGNTRDVVGLAVHELRRRTHDATVQLHEQLVAQAHAENRDAALERGNQVGRNTGLVGRAGAGRDHQVRGRQRLGLSDGDRVVAPHDHLIGTGLRKPVRQVVRKRVEVVDQEHADHRP